MATIATPSFPAQPDEIDDAWLSRILGAEVRSHRVEPLHDRQGVNGETHRIFVDGDGTPGSIVAKFPYAPSRGVAVYQRWYEREVRFYRELAPQTPFRTPRCYAAEIAPTDDFVLVLEDLGGHPQGDQVTGCSAVQAASVVRSLAGLHARWWEPRPTEHPWLPFTTVGLQRGRPVQGAFARAWERVRDSVEPGARALLDAGVESYVDLLTEISTGPVTLCHGDFRLDNLFLPNMGSSDGVTGEGGTEVIAFDWQFACRARGAYDLAYFLALDLEPGELATHEDALLEGYRAALAARGVDYDAARLRRDYAVSLILSTAVFAIGAGGPQPSEASRVMHEVGLARLGAAIARWSAAGWPERPSTSA